MWIDWKLLQMQARDPNRQFLFLRRRILTSKLPWPVIDVLFCVFEKQNSRPNYKHSRLKMLDSKDVKF